MIAQYQARRDRAKGSCRSAAGSGTAEFSGTAQPGVPVVVAPSNRPPLQRGFSGGDFCVFPPLSRRLQPPGEGRENSVVGRLDTPAEAGACYQEVRLAGIPWRANAGGAGTGVGRGGGVAPIMFGIRMLCNSSLYYKYFVV